MHPSDIRPTASGHLIQTDGGFWAFVPAPPPALTFTSEFVERLSAADAALGELSGLAGGRRDPRILVAPFLRQEAVLSSRIEGTPATLVDLLFDEVAAAPDQQLREELREVRNYAAALQYGVERLSEIPFGTKLVLELHERLLRGVRDPAWTPGELRTGQNWIGPPGSTIETAVYVPPPVPEMHAALAEWDRFVGERTGLPPLVHCGLMHERFEAIHPFLEGNGRLGRLLIPLFLIARSRLSHPLLYPSAYIEAHRDEYYGLLQAVRTHGAWEPWLLFFIDAVRDTADRAAEQVHALLALREQYRWKVSGHARRLVDDLFRTPFVTVPEAQQALGVSNATARKAVQELQEWGMLEELAARRWPRAYIARPILDAIQAPLEDLRLTAEARPKAAPLKSATDVEEPPERPAERHMTEAMALIDEARRYGVQVRLMGGLAVRRYCTDLGFMDREYSDIDLVGLSVQSRELHEVFTRLGYAENRAVTEATGAGQLQYVKTDVLEGAGGAYRIGADHGADAGSVDHVDVFMDVMRMDHDLDVRERLLVDDYAISPADAFIGKLQIARMNEKDVHDVIALLKDMPLRQVDDETSLCVPYIADTCAGDWGLCQDLLANIDVVLQMVDDYDLDDEEMARVYGRLTAIREAIETEEKSVGWRLRARVGRRVGWRRTIEDQEGTDVIAPEWDWRRDLG
ncbi:MAG: Fic family protein [Actinobacteria bacterium]|nr:Fic family protein [Actinomycetota bacterium]